MSFEIKGLDELQKNLRKLQERAEKLDGAQVPLTELFATAFMRAQTQFGTIQELFDAYKSSPVESQDDFDRLIQSEEWNAFIERTTQFGTWGELYQAAAQDHIARKLGVQ